MQEANIILFKEWIQNQMKVDIVPIFYEKGYRKGRTNCFIREKGNTVQYVQFQVKQGEVIIWGGASPIYFPLDGDVYHHFKLTETEKWIHINGVTGKMVIDRGVYWIVTPEVIDKWNEAKRIIQTSILPQLDQIHDLDELMEKADFCVVYNDTWRGVRWYAEGVYQCLSKDFDAGIEKLKKAQLCKADYLEFLKDTGSVFGKKGDQVSVIYNYIDMFCNAISGENYSREIFLEVYEQVCEDSKKWYKIKR